MAQIPLGDFSQARAIPRAEGSRLSFDSVNQAGRGAAAIGEALQDVSNVAASIATREKAEEQRQADALARAKAGNALSAYRLQVQAVVDDVSDQLRRGGDYTKAGSLYDEAVGKIELPQIDGLSPDAMESFTGGMANDRQAGRLRVDGAVVSARRDDGQAQFGIALDLAGKTAGQPGADVEAVNAQLRASEQFFIAGFGLDKSVTGKAIQDRVDANWTNQAAQRFNEGHDDIAALQQLLGDVTDDAGFYAGKLDGEKRAAIAGRIGARIDVLQGKAERAIDKADTIAERALVAIDEQTASLVPATVEQWAAWSDVFKAASPELRQQFVERIEDEKEAQALLRLPIEQQMSAVQAKQAKLYTEGGDKRARTNAGRLQSAVEANLKLLKETPLQFASAREDTKVEPLDFAALADPAKSAVVTSQLQQRAATVGDLRKRYGDQVQNRILLPQEAEMMVTTLAGLPPGERLKVFGALQRVAGGKSNYAAIMQQIQPDAPVMAMAGMMYTTQPGTAKLIIEGDALLNRGASDKAGDGQFKGVKMPPQADFDSEVDNIVGDAFRGRPEAYNVAMQAVRAAYAGATAGDGDVSGNVNFTRLKKVAKLVLSEPVNYNGRGRVFTPHGMDEDDFEDKVEAAWGAVAGQLPAGAPKDLGMYGLQQAGDGRYYVTSGRMFVSDQNGNPITLEIRR